MRGPLGFLLEGHFTPFMWAPPSGPNHLPKTPPPEVRVSTYGFQNTFNLLHTCFSHISFRSMVEESMLISFILATKMVLCLQELAYIF